VCHGALSVHHYRLQVPSPPEILDLTAPGGAYTIVYMSGCTDKSRLEKMIPVRTSRQDHQRFTELARAQDRSLSAWVRLKLRAAVTKEASRGG
jgi:hypothetical protein